MHFRRAWSVHWRGNLLASSPSFPYAFAAFGACRRRSTYRPHRPHRMLSQYTRKHRRDRALFDHWDRLDDAVFERAPRAQLKAAQAKLQGHIVLPGSPDYDNDRKLSNPVFDAYPIVIIYCAVESDVAIALELARALLLPFT